MNCKPGDLAVVVRSEAGNEGKTLTCLQLFPAGYDDIDISFGPIWETDRNDISFFQFGRVGSGNCVPDSQLRPIRDNPGNESWFTAAPRSKPATTKQDTIDARGMMRS